jgi:ABC-type nitrate/sulfonate/bicarbonate transport system substrate-binding protein
VSHTRLALLRKVARAIQLCELRRDASEIVQDLKGRDRSGRIAQRREQDFNGVGEPSLARGARDVRAG